MDDPGCGDGTVFDDHVRQPIEIIDGPYDFTQQHQFVMLEFVTSEDCRPECLTFLPCSLWRDERHSIEVHCNTPPV